MNCVPLNERNASPSISELSELAERYHVSIPDDEMEDVYRQVSSMLERLDPADEVPVDAREKVGDREWEEPSDNPHNFLSSWCDMRPSADHTGPSTGDCRCERLAVAGISMNGGSRVMQGYVPRTDATVTERILAAGGTITAKTNLDEFATSGWGTSSYLGQITNPHDEDHTADGSSGGSAVKVAIDEVNGLPVGLQLMGSAFREDEHLATAATIDSILTAES